MKKTFFLIITLLILTSFGIGVIAQNDIELPKPGIKPDSFFYFLDTFGERIRLFFTFGAEKKVERALEYAGEKLSEAKVMVEKNNPKALKKAVKEYLYYLKIANQKLAKAKEKGKLVDLISEKNLNYQKALLAELDKVTKETKDEVKKAIEESQESFGDTIKEASEEKLGELEQKLEDLKNELEEKLKEAEERLEGEEEEEDDDGELKAPEAPALNDPGATSVSGSSFTVSWNKVSRAVSYTLERDVDSSFPSPIVIYAGENNSYTGNPSVASATTYYYRVKASNSVGDSPWSNAVDIKITVGAPPTAPSAPTLNDPGSSLSAGTSFSISWSKPAGAANYILQRDTNSSFSSPAEVYSGTKNNTAETLSPSDATTYYYRAKASNSAGSSSWSNTVDIEITVEAPPPSVDPPSAPALDDPGDSFDAGTSIGISWSAVEGATNYKLERDDNSSFSSPTLVYSGALNYYSETLSPAATKTYYYRVKASNSAGSSSWSNVEDVTINCLLPGAPTLSDPGSSIAAGDSFQLTWSAVSGADSYRVEIDDIDSSFSNSAGRPLTAAANITETLTIAGTYYYRVRAVNDCGDGPWSNTVDITVGTAPSAPTLDDPGDIHPTNLAFNLTWSAVPDAISYTGEYDTNPSFSSPTSVTLGAVTSYSITHTAAGTYYYRGKATTAFGDSSWSNIVDLQIIPFISDVPDANQPPPNLLAFPWVGSFCTPMASANVTEYWDVVQGDPNAVGVNIGLGEGYGPPWVVADYIGWFMNTNGLGSWDRFPAWSGTAIINIAPGLLDWLVWDAQDPTVFGFPVPALVALAVGKTSYVSWSVKTTHAADISQAQAWDDYCSEIDSGRPVIISFDFWNPLITGITHGAIDFYDWGPEIFGSYEAPEAPPDVEEEWYPGDPEFASGHTVTGVGYLQNYDPGDGGGARDWAVIHDNWWTTPENVAIPWNNWLANTYVQPLPNTAPETPTIYDPGDSITAGNNYWVNWDRVSGTKHYCYQWDTEPSFAGAMGACTMDGSTLSAPGANTSTGVTTYYYQVQACNDYGCSSYSDTVDMIVSIGPLRRVPDDYSTIQGAINAANSGDVVYVAEPGTYIGEIDLKDDVSLIGTGPDNITIKAGSEEFIGINCGSNSTIQGFKITDAKTDLIRCDNKSNVIIRNNLLVATSTDPGYPTCSGIVIRNCSITIQNNTIVSPEEIGGSSVGIFTDTAANNLIVMNTIIEGSFEAGIRAQGGTAVSSYNDIKLDSAGNEWVGGVISQGAGDIIQDPQFVNPSSRDYHLQTGSPCVNTGNPNANYNDIDGSRNDMGAYGGPVGQ